MDARLRGDSLAEYYLRTGDETILPVVEDAVRAAEELYMPGGWSTRGYGVWTYYGGGRMNAAGVHVLSFLLLARECGVEVDETVLQGALRQYFRFAGRGNVAYGDHRPEFLQRRKLPPLDADMFLRAARVTPMISTAWQAMQDPERSDEASPDEGTFLWDGTMTPNRALRGNWTQLGRVESIEAFAPGRRLPTNARWPLQSIAFQDNGRTDHPLLFYTGDILMDLDRNEALEITLQTVDGDDFLFIEAGGFDARHGSDWKPAVYVLKRDR